LKSRRIVLYARGSKAGRNHADFLPKLPDERVRQGFVFLDAATGEALHTGVGVPRRTASSEKHRAVADE
jgi:hypothetical protein